MNREIEFEGIGALNATFKAHGSVSAIALASGAAAVENLAVTVTGNQEMGLGTAGDALRGVIDKYEDDNYMTVQVRGYRTVPGVSAALPTANEHLVVNGSGAVSEIASPLSPAYAVSVDDTADVNMVTIFIG